jgi:hypothetical protein
LPSTGWAACSSGIGAAGSSTGSRRRESLDR